MDAYHDDGNEDSRPSNFRACQVCRQRKVKCVALPDAESCEYCIKHRVECVQIEPAQKRRRQNTQAELKARVEQLEEKLSQTLNEHANSGYLPVTLSSDEVFIRRPDHSVLETAPNPAPAAYFSSPSVPITQHMRQSTLRSDHNGYNDARTIARPSSIDHLLIPRDQSNFRIPVENYSKHGLHAYPPTLPPPNASPLLHNSPDVSFRLPVVTNNFSPSSERYSLPRTSTLDGTPPPGYTTPQSPYTRENPTHPSFFTSTNPPVSKPDRPDTSQGSILNKCIGIQPHVAESPISPKDSRIHRKILGPMPAFDSSFYELCLRRGLATAEDRECMLKDKFWTRFFRLSKDPVLPLYQISFDTAQELPDCDVEQPVPEAARAKLDAWTDAYGEVLLATFNEKILPRYGVISDSRGQMSKADVKKQPVSLTCAGYALASQCVESWSIKKRFYLGFAFHFHAMSHLHKEMVTVSLESVKILFLLAEFSTGLGSSLLNSWAMAHAFELRLNVDPEHWAIPEKEKDLRRRMFWLALVTSRWTALQDNAPSVDPDYYDTRQPIPNNTMDEIKLLEIMVSEDMTQVCRTFYSVRGAKMAYHSVTGSTTICAQLEDRLAETKQKVLSKFPKFEAGTSPTAGLAIALCLIQLEIGTIRIHRPFFDNPMVNLVESLEHHRKALTAACGCVDLIARMPDSYFTEAWPTGIRHILASFVMFLLQECVLSPDENMRAIAKGSLDIFSDVLTRQSTRWMMVRFASTMMNMASTLSGGDFGSKDVVPEFASSTGGDSRAEFESPHFPEMDWERMAAFEWDDLSQVFGGNSGSIDWFSGVK